MGPYRSFPQLFGSAGRMDGSEVVFGGNNRLTLVNVFLYGTRSL
ncbi:hypothetical protein BMS3Abin06_00702 [bacterium BMS3Abin06]|nr:hypothetical protein BMS3Abin06_00702 [bacterium BMS3Abin06]